MSTTTTDPADPGTVPTADPTPVTTPVVVPDVTPDVTDLGAYIPALQREVSLPGSFATDYPEADEDSLLFFLADAFSEAQLDAWFSTFTIDPATALVSPSLSPAAAQLVVLYAGMRWVRIELKGLKTLSRYKAGPVEYEVQQGASVLVQLLKDLTARKDALIAAATAGARTTYVLDGVYGRERYASIGAFAPVELPGVLLGITR